MLCEKGDNPKEKMEGQAEFSIKNLKIS